MRTLKSFALVCFMLGFSIVSYGQTNLIENWDGNGDVNATTSFPNNYGWEVIPGSFNYANSSSGVRYADVTSGHQLNGNNYSGRLLMLRWDGVGSTTLNSIYSYPAALVAGKQYQFSWVYEWWNNATSPTFTVKISKDRAGTDVIATKQFNASATRNVLLADEMLFQAPATQTYYVTIQANTAALAGIGELRLVEVVPTLRSNKPSVHLSYYTSSVDLTIFPNGSTNTITVTAPTGIRVSQTNLPSTGGAITVSSTDSSMVTGIIKVQQGSDVLDIPITTSFPANFLKLSKIDTLNVDGAWCWFNDPRAIYYKGTKEQTYFSWVNSVGDIWISAYNHKTGEYKEHLLYPKLEVDDHDNPAIFIREDGHIIVYFSKHTSAPAHRYISARPEDITSWGSDYQFGQNVTYPYPFKVEDKIYVFYRGLNWHPTVAISSDGGETMGTPQLFITGGGARPYTRYAQDPTGAIHIAVTTGHPRNEAANRIYYALFKNGKFYKADGTFIKDYTGSSTALNIDTEAEVVYNSNIGKGWIWDLTFDAENKPVMVYASFPTDTDHRYHYARWTGTTWFRKQITNAGKWFPQTRPGATEAEPNYSGGISLDYNDPSIAYLSKPVNGVFEIFKFTTLDKGVTWDSVALTWNTPAHLINVRPIVPRHHKKGFFDVLWMRGTYASYTNYNTSIVFHMDSTVNTVNRIVLSTETTEILQGTSKQVTATFEPFITRNKNLTWSSSDNSIASVESGKITGVKAGNATITATGANGVTAQIQVTVISPAFAPNTYFDFGTPESPAMAGAVQVSNNTMLQNSFGWQSSVLSRDRGSVATDELRDFNMGSANADFVVFVQPGTYRVVAKQGDQSFLHDNMNIFANDELKVSSVSTAAGEYVTSEFDVAVTGNALKFTFTDGGGADANWVINSLKITRNLTSAENERATKQGYFLYPNPTRKEDGLFITGKGTSKDELQITIHTITGKVEKQLKLNAAKQNKIDVSNLAPGLYIVQVISANGSFSQKIIIQ